MATILAPAIAPAFFGGLFAAAWANHFETKRRIRDRRHDKYHEHRNTIVQIEHELIPLRLNISRDIASISNAIDNTNDQNVRFILRFYKLFLSAGLNLRLLNIDLINKYAELYSDIESFNSDVDYVSGMVLAIREDQKAKRTDPTIVESYKAFLIQLKDECEQIDQKSLELLGMSKLAIGKEDTKVRGEYVSDGKKITYSFDEKMLKKECEEITKEEDGSLHKNEEHPKFFYPYLDLKKVPISVQ